MTGNKKHLNTRAVRIIWAITCGYKSPEALIVKGQPITLTVDTINDAFEFSDDAKVYTYRQAADRIEKILYSG